MRRSRQTTLKPEAKSDAAFYAYLDGKHYADKYPGRDLKQLLYQAAFYDIFKYRREFIRGYKDAFKTGDLFDQNR
jgi:hypothetical protein